MKNTFATHLFLACLFISVTCYSQKVPGKFQSISAHGFVAGMSNYNLELIQPSAYFGGGLSYSYSLTNDLNLFGGLSYIEHELIYPKYAYSDCDSEDGKCWKESVSTQIHIPIGTEFYLNNNTLGLRSYYRLSLAPSFSVKEKIVVTKTLYEPVFENREYIEENNGIRFQDLFLRFSLGTEIQLYKAFSLFLEPTIQHTMLFRSEEVVSPNYIFSFNIGFRIRTEN